MGKEMGHPSYDLKKENKKKVRHVFLERWHLLRNIN